MPFLSLPEWQTVVRYASCSRSNCLGEPSMTPAATVLLERYAPAKMVDEMNQRQYEAKSVVVYSHEH